LGFQGHVFKVQSQKNISRQQHIDLWFKHWFRFLFNPLVPVSK